MQEDHRTRIKKAKDQITKIIKENDLVGFFVIAAPGVVSMDRHYAASYTNLQRVSDEAHLLHIKAKTPEERNQAAQDMATTMKLLHELETRAYMEGKTVKELMRLIEEGVRQAVEKDQLMRGDKLKEQISKN